MSNPDVMGCDGMGWDGMGWDGMGWDGMGCVPVLCRTRIVTILHLNACAINLRRVNAVMAI